MDNGYIVSGGPMMAQQLNFVFERINERLNDLEHKNSKTNKKIEISRGEKSAILYELGVFDFLLNQGIPQKKIAGLLSLIFNASQSNIEKDLSLRNSSNAPFKIKGTYKNISKIFKELDLEELQIKVQTTLDKLED